jgi:hypothetical protein
LANFHERLATISHCLLQIFAQSQVHLCIARYSRCGNVHPICGERCEVTLIRQSHVNYTRINCAVRNILCFHQKGSTKYQQKSSSNPFVSSFMATNGSENYGTPNPHGLAPDPQFHNPSWLFSAAKQLLLLRRVLNTPGRGNSTLLADFFSGNPMFTVNSLQ